MVVEKQFKKKVFLEQQTYVLTVNMSSGSCMVMQSILIWMVFPADPSVGLSVKFSSMGWTEWMADLKHKRHIFFLVTKVCFWHLHYNVVWHCWLTDPAYQTVGWIHPDWRSQLSVMTDSGTWQWGRSSLSRTNETKGPWVCKETGATTIIFILLLIF